MLPWGKRLQKFFVTFLVLFFINACLKKRVSRAIVKPVFISYPENNFSFHAVSSLVYKELVTCFLRLGYNVVCVPFHGCYVIRTKIDKLERMQKYICPDMVIADSVFEMVIECCVERGNCCLRKKNFNDIVVIPRSLYMTFNDCNSYYCFSDLARKMAVKVEQLVHEIVK
jgi:hypothetical protein